MVELDPKDIIRPNRKVTFSDSHITDKKELLKTLDKLIQLNSLLEQNRLSLIKEIKMQVQERDAQGKAGNRPKPEANHEG